MSAPKLSDKAFGRIPFICSALVFALGLLFVWLKLSESKTAPKAVLPEPTWDKEIPTHHKEIRTYEHDGHLFVMHNNAGLLHHPDCKCFKKP